MTLARKVRAVRCHLEIHVSSLYFLTELLLGEKYIMRAKEFILKLISSLLLPLVVGCCLILTAFYEGKRQKHFEGEISVYYLKGRAEKPVSGIAKRTLGLAQIHGDEPKETLHSLSPCARKSALPDCQHLPSQQVWR